MWLLVKLDPSKLAWIALSTQAKPMAENMYRLLWSGIIAVIVTVVVSFFTRPKPLEELTGLVYGCTDLPSEGHLPLVTMFDAPRKWRP
jgi:SSS family solute:Na+ symporter